MAQRHPDPGLAVNGEGPATPRRQAWQALLLPAAPPPGSPGFPFRATAQPATSTSKQGDYRPGGITGGREGLGGLGVPQGPWSCAGSSWPHGDLRATSRAGSEGRGGQRGKGPPEGTVGGRAVTDPGDPTVTRDVFCETLSVLKTPCSGASPRERKAKCRQRGDTGGRRGRRVVSRGHVPP